MSRKARGWRQTVLTVLLLTWFCSMAVLAEGASGDNSLYTLGILTEGATVSPDFYYSTIEYQVTVPAGTTELSLDPVTSNESASILDISGKTLEGGKATTVITVEAENGSQCSYYLYVTEEAPAQTEAQTERVTEAPTEAETEPETEDPRYVKVDRNSLQEAENTISALKAETADYRDRLNLMMMVLYGMIAFCVVLLFVVINLMLKKKDLKAELREYMSYGYGDGDEELPEEPKKKGSRRRAKQPANRQEAEDPWETQEAADAWTANAPQDPADAWEAQARHEEQAARQQQAQPVQKDDPATVPKPAKARKKMKPMPQYEAPQPMPEYQPPQEDSKDVEITMIDL